MTSWLHHLLTSVHDLTALALALLRDMSLALSRLVSLPEWWLSLMG